MISQKTPKWKKHLDSWRPDLIEKEIIVPCFERPIEKVGNNVLTATLHHDEISLEAPSTSARMLEKTAKVLSTALELAYDYDLEITGFEDTGSIELFRSCFWKNRKTGAFLTANFSILLQFEPARGYEQNVGLYYQYIDDSAVINGRYELRSKQLEEPKSLAGVRSRCKNFYEFMQKARVHPDIMAPFGRFDDLPAIRGAGGKDVFYIRYIDREGREVSDRFCFLTRSIYSMPECTEIKWIEGYSEKQRHRVDIKVANILSIKKELRDVHGNPMNRSIEINFIKDGVWILR